MAICLASLCYNFIFWPHILVICQATQPAKFVFWPQFLDICNHWATKYSFLMTQLQLPVVENHSTKLQVCRNHLNCPWVYMVTVYMHVWCNCTCCGKAKSVFMYVCPKKLLIQTGLGLCYTSWMYQVTFCHAYFNQSALWANSWMIQMNGTFQSKCLLSKLMNGTDEWNDVCNFVCYLILWDVIVVVWQSTRNIWITICDNWKERVIMHWN